MGAYLVARRVLASAHEVMVSGTLKGLESLDASKVKDRADASIGMTFLAFGFGLQLLAYLLQAGGVRSADASTVRALVAAALTVIGAGAAWVVYRSCREARIRAFARKVLRTNFDGSPILPPADRVLRLGRNLGYASQHGETYQRYASRIFGIVEIQQPDEPTIPSPSP